MSRILNYVSSLHFGKGHRRTLFAGTGGALFLAMVAAFGSVSNQAVYLEPATSVFESVNVKLNPVTEIAAAQDRISREIRIQRGDTVTSLFSALGIRDDEAGKFIRSNVKAAVIFRQLTPGKSLTAQLDQGGKLYQLSFPINGDKDSLLWVERTPDGFDAKQVDVLLETHVSMNSAVIRHSLFGAADAAGIPDNVAMQLADIFGGDIDFHRDLRKGDRFSVIYDTSAHLGRPIRAHRILAAEFINDGKSFRAFWFQDKYGRPGYYTHDGRSVRKAFLRSPLEFSRITSGFSNARFHPVLKETRAHRGIDYGAPIGTRVRTTGDGIVDFIGTQGGYGKLVQIRHAGDKTTLYGHLSGFAANLKKGARVTQGETIGFVGATGLASGPHLHYEFRVAGMHRNPLAITLPNSESLHASQLPAFKKHADEFIAQLVLAGEIKLAQLD